jgi:5'-deoxynucleotidase YfbR-like HD superfamily hydrolase
MAKTTPPRAWQRMLSGRRLDLLDPSPLDIEIEDIAHGLAFVARWNGQTHGEYPYSVAEHSLLVEQLFGQLQPKATKAARLTALLHDAPEYVIGDMISPVKAAVGPGYGALDDRLMEAVLLRFGLPRSISATLKVQIKKADRLSAWLEATQIAGFDIPEANRLFGKPSPAIAAIRLAPLAPTAARDAFVARHTALIAGLTP